MNEIKVKLTENDRKILTEALEKINDIKNDALNDGLWIDECGVFEDISRIYDLNDGELPETITISE